MKRISVFLGVLVIMAPILFCSKQQQIVYDMSRIALPDSVWSISAVCVSGKRLFILDYDRLSIWVADTSSHSAYEMKLSKGQGPKEVLMPVSMSVCNDRIFLLDARLSRVSQFDAAGNFINCFTHPYPGQIIKMHVKPDTIMILYGDDKTGTLVHYFDYEGNHLGDDIPFDALDYPEDILGLKGEDVKSIGMLFTPSDWAVQGDTIWIANRYSYQISAFHRGEKLYDIRDRGIFFLPPEHSTSGNEEVVTFGLQVNSQIFLSVYNSYLVVTVSHRLMAKNKNKVTYKIARYVYNRNDGTLLASVSAEGEERKKVPSIREVRGKEAFFTSEGRLSKGRISIK